ncbi:hypothetical protein B6S12_03395 [Helicobacter valdiviensis]|uniref:histidine kinase n=2 Tax=Helicobacter valdiviensis TaxID=1458358 RepID=A0A2W6MW39_9HELI|nr:hypothetical protein B6S12_03395 [Helicobacter valdiviensis]
MQSKMLYYATQATLQNEIVVLRLAMPKSNVEENFEEFLPFFALEFVLCLLLSFMIARVLTASIIKPLKTLTLDNLSQKMPYRELEPFIKALKQEHKAVKNKLKGLEHKQNQMLLLTQNMSDGIILLNKDGKILLVNERAEEYFNAISNLHSIYELKDALFLQKILPLLTLFKKHKKQQTEFVTLGNKECEVVFCPIHSKDKFKGIIIILHDLDAQKQAQKLRREFSANVTHELKTPLTSILASSEMLSNGLVSKEDTQQFLQKIEKEAKRLLEMIDEILRLSFLDEAQDHLPMQTVELKNIIQNVFERLKIIANNNKITLLSDLQECTIRGNGELLENLIYNLCDNAIKYNNKGGFVKVTLKKEQDGICLSVKDNGIGIPKESHKRIFERFYCVDKGRSKQLGGTGLGLSIVKSVAKLHHAKIEVKSKAGKGSEFLFYFP